MFATQSSDGHWWMRALVRLDLQFHVLDCPVLTFVGDRTWFVEEFKDELERLVHHRVVFVWAKAKELNVGGEETRAYAEVEAAVS